MGLGETMQVRNDEATNFEIEISLNSKDLGFSENSCSKVRGYEKDGQFISQM